MKDILYLLADLHKQATEERSHNYTAEVISKAMAEIIRLRKRIEELEEEVDGG